MRTKQALKNMISSLMLQVVLALSGVIIPRFFTAVYGSAINGLVSSINQFISYLCLVEAGVGAAGTVALYGPLADKDNKSVNEILSATRVFYLRSGVIFAVLALLMVIGYPIIVQNEIADASFVRMMVVILCVNGIVDYFFLGKYRVLLQADQKGYVVSAIQIIGTIIMTIVSIVLIEANAPALLVKSVVAIVYFGRSIAVAIYVKINYPYVNFLEKPRMEAIDQRHAALLHQIVGMIVCNTDMVLLTLMLDKGALVEVSVYSIYNLVAYSMTNVMNSISNGLGAGFGQIMSQNENEVMKKSYSSFEYMFFLFIFVSFTCMGALLHPFIGVYSMNFEDGACYVRWSLVILFTVAGLLQSIRLPGLTLICAAGHFKQTRIRAVWEAVINFTVSVMLVRPFGIAGVLFGTCASYLYRSTEIIFYSESRFLKGHLAKTFGRIARNVVLMGWLWYTGVKIIPQMVGGWLEWIMWAAGYAIVVVLAFVGVNAAFEPEQIKELVNRVRKLR